MAKKTFLHGKRLVFFEALQGCLTPRFLSFDANRRKKSADLVNLFLETRSAAERFQLAAFFLLINLISLFMEGKCFKHLSSSRQERVAAFLCDCPLGLVRKGFWGVNTLAKMGVYGLPEVYADLGYVLKETPQ